MTQPEPFNPEDLLQDSEKQKENQAKKLSLEEVVQLGEQLKTIDHEIVVQSAALEELQAQRRAIAEEQLPQALVELGLKDFTLSSGEKVVLEEVINASITDENRELAHLWLRENGFADLIKNEVKVTFGKGEDEEAQKLQRYIQELAAEDKLRFGGVDQKETVHPSTLRAFVKDQLKSGASLPAETFKLFIYQRAGLEKPKRKKV